MRSPEVHGATVAGVVYALVCYAVTNAGLGTFVLFINDLVLPFGVSDAERHPLFVALAIDFLLVSAWGLQHSVMARKRFKDVWTQIIPPHTERATYCLASAIALGALCFLWAPVPGTVWSIDAAWIAWPLQAAGALGWVLLLAATFEIDHFELFGLRQAVDAARGRTPSAATFQMKRIYRRIRHPIQTGVLVGMWLTPNMSMSRLTLAIMMTLYILVGLYFEEKDLVRQFGDRYRTYIRDVPKLIPSLTARRRSA